MRQPIFTAAALLSLVIFPGCLVQSVDQQPGTTTSAPDYHLTSENSAVAGDPDSVFSLTLPKGYRIETYLNQDGARLLTISKGTGATQENAMFVEETGNSTTVSVDLLAQTQGLSLVRREPLSINGFDATRAIATTDKRPGVQVNYYFIAAGGKTYVLSLPGGGDPWPYYEQVVASFHLTK